GREVLPPRALASWSSWSFVILCIAVSDGESLGAAAPQDTPRLAFEFDGSVRIKGRTRMNVNGCRSVATPSDQPEGVYAERPGKSLAKEEIQKARDDQPLGRVVGDLALLFQRLSGQAQVVGEAEDADQNADLVAGR